MKRETVHTTLDRQPQRSRVFQNTSFHAKERKDAAFTKDVQRDERELRHDCLPNRDLRVFSVFRRPKRAGGWLFPVESCFGLSFRALDGVE